MLGWRKGSNARSYSPNKPMRVNVYAAITKHGITNLALVAGTSKLKTKLKNKKGAEAKNITAAEYAHVLQNTLLPECGKKFQEVGIMTWVFQQDNDPTHKKTAPDVITKWNLDNPGQNVTLLPNWPPNSPDLNIIENVWAWAQAKVDATVCHNFVEFQATVINTLLNMEKGKIATLFERFAK